MKILIHICCAPCSIYPLKRIQKKFTAIQGFFYRSNIHPYTECIKREKAVKEYTTSLPIQVIYQKKYDIEAFIRNVAFRETNRCLYCYYDRLLSSAILAKKNHLDYFSTTLLYSKFQNHTLIKLLGESISKSIGIPFYYDDFRIGWKEGINKSKELKMYRQTYCGCIYSEKERYFKHTKTEYILP